MALPKHFGTSHPKPQRNRASKVTALPEPEALPNISLPEIDDVTPTPRQRGPQRPRPATSREASPKKRTSSQGNARSQDSIQEGYAVDEKTGEKFKVLPGVKDPSFIRGSSKSISDRAQGLSVEDFRNLIGEDEDFSAADTFFGDLTDLAKTFLPHLRVPPDEKEIQEMRQEKIRQKQLQDKAYAEQLAKWKRKEGEDK